MKESTQHILAITTIALFVGGLILNVSSINKVEAQTLEPKCEVCEVCPPQIIKIHCDDERIGGICVKNSLQVNGVKLDFDGTIEIIDDEGQKESFTKEDLININK